MTSPDFTISEPEVCPYLGLPDDPRTRFTFADPAHRCHVRAKPVPIDLGHQGAYCLATGYPTCKRFRPLKAATPPASGPVRSLHAVIATPALAAESRDGGTSRGSGLARRRAAALLAGLAVLVLIGALGVAANGGFPSGSSNDVAASPSSAATPAPTTTSAGTPSPAPVPGATPSPTPSATPAPSRRPVATPIIRVVVSGETLTSIAAYYGVTVKAIQDANKIAYPSIIVPGQLLVIPPP